MRWQRAARRGKGIAAASASASAIAVGYEEIPYPTRPFPELHPTRLATQALVFGMDPAPPEHCRVLEIGCGDGGNLVPMAWELPKSEFVGVDVARGAIDAAHEQAQRLGLANLSLHHLDLASLDDAFESFDYVIANGVYSWVAPEVGERLLEVCRARLARRGVALVTYKAYPGAHVSDLARRLLRFHTRDAPEAEERIAAVRQLLEVLPAGLRDDAYGRYVSEHLERLRGFSDSALYHDEMSTEHSPVLFSAFVKHAERHGLRYLADAEPRTSRPVGLPSQSRRALEELDGDPLAREQYLDFLTGRPFRQTLLCRRETKLAPEPSAERIDRLFAAAQLRPRSGKLDLAKRSVTEFRAPDQGSIATDDPLLKAALVALAEAWPRRLPFAELLEQARGRLHVATDDASQSGEPSAAALARMLIEGYVEGVLELAAHAPRVASRAGERPVASELARRQAAGGQDPVTSLLHSPVAVGSESSTQLLLRLDGSRDRAALVHELKGSSVKDVERELRRFAELGLLVE